MIKTIFLFILLMTGTSYGAVTVTELLQLEDRINAVYSSELMEKEATLEFVFNTDSKILNAFAKKETPKEWKITIHGGFISHPKMNYNSMALILCHELGHFLGGRPFVEGRRLTPTMVSRAPKEMSVEGQADFFATAECGKRVLAGEQPAFEITTFEQESIFCNSASDPDLCKVLHQASKRVIDIYTDAVRAITGYDYPYVNYNRKDPLVVERSLIYVGEYPTLQCRLDTMAAGIDCKLDSSGKCVLENGELVEKRPACWFKP
ncbi:MAG: hypothetical protein ACLGHN_16280 [Bacteriovoracia bacterium]